MNKEQEVNKVVDFIYEVIEYLHDWISSIGGEYHPISFKNVEQTVLIILQKNNFNFFKTIKEFKDSVGDGKIIFNFEKSLSTPKLKSVWPELYKRHKEKVKEFEKKYNIK